jgi:excisionase family DNA binding protein
MQKVQDTPQPLLLNIEQAMQVLCLGRTKIYDLMENKNLPFLKIGKALRFSYKALQEWIDQQPLQN